MRYAPLVCPDRMNVGVYIDELIMLKTFHVGIYITHLPKHQMICIGQDLPMWCVPCRGID